MSFCVADLEFEHEVNDELMRYVDQCKRLIHDVVNNSTAFSELDLFRSKPEMRRVREKMADRLRVPHSDITPGSLLAAL